MIIENNGLKIGDVVSLRLCSGEEVIGRLVSNLPNEIRIRRPIMAIMQPTGRGDFGLAFGPFMASAADIDEVVFPIGSLICRPVATRDDVASGYKQATSPILTPDKSLII